MLTALVLLALMAAPGQAERKFEKKEGATNVVTGKVVHVYSRTTGRGDLVYTHYILELQVDSVEKGQGFNAGEVLYVRCFKRTKSPQPAPPGAAGHRYIPKEGEPVRVFVNRQKDGGYEIAYPDGVESLDKPKK
jgi:hypothetical protein